MAVEPLDMSADDALAAEARKADRKGGRGPIPEKCREAMEHVRHHLRRGPERHGATRQAIEAKGVTTGSFYRALDELGVVKFEDENGKKWLRLPPGSEPEEPPDETPETLPFEPGKPS